MAGSGVGVLTVDTVAERLGAVRSRIVAAGGSNVRVVAVTKGFGPDAIEAAVAAGCRDIGENYAQELIAKLPEVRGPAPVVHFVGHLQTNKVKHLAPVVDVWQSVDRLAAVEALSRHAAPGATVMVQVNVADEPQQGGCAPADAADIVAAACDVGLKVTGLMAIGRAGGSEAARPGFRTLRRLVDDLGLTECSMGMTDDLEAAVEEGSTMVRVGTALFGPRQSHHRTAQAN
jgi:pyridoxal phosphate enzyme (YggS family)